MKALSAVLARGPCPPERAAALWCIACTLKHHYMLQSCCALGQVVKKAYKCCLWHMPQMLVFCTAPSSSCRTLCQAGPMSCLSRMPPTSTTCSRARTRRRCGLSPSYTAHSDAGRGRCTLALLLTCLQTSRTWTAAGLLQHGATQAAASAIVHAVWMLHIKYCPVPC